ncbi:hypothetical protein K8R66_02805 [bacterium]|nr:hypothetical protein [bacterium]
MNKKIQLIILVILSFCLILFFWLYINNNSKKDSNNLEFDNSLKILKNIFSEKINSYQEEEKEEEKKEIKKRIAQNVINSLLSENNFIEYQNETWGIKFNYDQKMNRVQFNDKNEQKNKILLNYKNGGIIIEKVISEKKFSDWLNENFDLQKLEKKNNNDNIFWYQDLKNYDFPSREYYTQIEKTIYTISASSTKEDFIDWEEMEKTILSIQKY